MGMHKWLFISVCLLFVSCQPSVADPLNTLDNEGFSSAATLDNTDFRQDDGQITETIEVPESNSVEVDSTPDINPTPTVDYVWGNIPNTPLTRNFVSFSPEECSSVCWYGLELGKTTFEEAQPILEELLAPPENRSLELESNNEVDYLQVTWVDEQLMSTYNSVYLIVLFNPETQVFEEVNIQTIHSGYIANLSVLDLMKGLGPPSEIWVDRREVFETTDFVTRISVEFIWEESQTLAIFHMLLPMLEIDESMAQVNWCLLDDTANHTERWRFVISTNSFENYQEWSDTNSLYRPIQEFFSISPLELYKLALAQEDVCLDSVPFLP